MRLRNVAGLALALALFAGILGWLHERQQPPAQPPASRAWLPGLKPHQVTALCIATPANRRSAPGAMARTGRSPARTAIPPRGNHPAAVAQPGRRAPAGGKSASPENRERMGLSDQGKGQASRITLERGDAPPLVLLLGKRTSQGGQLVRQADDEGAWLIDRTVGLPVNDLALLDPRLTDLPFEQLRELTLSYGNGVRLNISRASEKDDGIRLQQFPSRPQLMGEAEAEQAARLFAALRLLEVAPAKASRQKPLLTFTLKSFAGGTLQGQLLELERQYWLQLTDSKGFSDGQVSAVKGWRYRVEGLSPDTAPAPQPPKASPVKQSKPAKPSSPKC